MGIPLSVLDPCSEDVDPYLLEHQHPRFRGKLPVELLVTITEFLLGDLCYRTAANMNVACRIVQAETSSALYAAVVWQYPYFEAIANALESFNGWQLVRQRRASSYRYIRYLVIENVPVQSPVLRKGHDVSTQCDHFQYSYLFPNVKMVTWKSNCVTLRGTILDHKSIRSCHVIAFQEVAYAMIPVFIRSKDGYLDSVYDPPDGRRRPEFWGFYEQISHLLFRGKGILIVGDSTSSGFQGRAQFVDCLSPHKLDVTVDPYASENLSVDVIRDISGVDDDLVYGPNWRAQGWKGEIQATSALLTNYVIAASGSSTVPWLVELNLFSSPEPQLAYHVNPTRPLGNIFVLREPISRAEFRPVLDAAINEYLLARRRFYDELDDSTQPHQLRAMWQRHQAFTWQMEEPTMLKRVQKVMDSQIGCIVGIVWRPFARSGNQQTMLFNADTRGRGQQPVVRLFVTSADPSKDRLAGGGDPGAFEQMYREGKQQL